MELPDLPDGWHINFLCRRGPGEWVLDVINPNENAFLHVTGTTPRFAMLTAIERIANDDFFVRSASLTREGAKQIATADVLSALKIPQKQIDRRF